MLEHSKKDRAKQTLLVFQTQSQLQNNYSIDESMIYHILASIAPSKSCRKNPFRFGSSYGVMHSVIDDFFMQSFVLVVYCEPEAKLRDTSLRQGGDVVSGLTDSVTCRVSAVLHLIIVSHLFIWLI